MPPLLDLKYAQIRQADLVDPAESEGTRDGKRGSVLLEASNISFERGEVYSLEGPNQSGKSTLISALLGVYGGEGKRSNSTSLSVEIRIAVEGRDRSTFRSPAEAARSGIAAVFQDDELIGTLTVREQLLLRHSLRGLPALITWASNKYVSQRIEDIRGLAIRVREVQNRLLPSMPTVLTASEVNDRASAFLSEVSAISGVDYRSVLDRRPIELSGGAKAVARLVSTLITPNLKLVFFDEAFRGIQSDVWPYLVDALKAIARQNGITIVAVSHNRDEIVRWQPRARFCISDKLLVQIEPKNHTSLIPSVEVHPEFYPVFTLANMSDSQWNQIVSGNSVIIADSAIMEHSSYRIILSRMNLASKGQLKVFELSGGECNKTFDHYRELVDNICGTIKGPVETFVVVGGGVVLNLGGFVAATIDRGAGRLILVPTTVMAIADVAVGSKTGVNLICSPAGGGPTIRKHGIGVYRNPDAVLLDGEFLQSLPPAEIRNGLAECLKHGLCQSKPLYADCLEAISRGCSPAQALAIGSRTMALKAQLLSIDPRESGISRILQFGHLHAHALERALTFGIPHGWSVYWGLLVECVLCKTGGLATSQSAAEEIANAVLASRMFEDWTLRISSEAILQFYESDSKSYHRAQEAGSFRTLLLPSVGTFENVYEFRSETALLNYIRELTPDAVRAAIEEVRSKLRI